MTKQRLICRKMALLLTFSTAVACASERLFAAVRSVKPCGQILSSSQLVVLEVELRLRSEKNRLFLAADEILNLLTTSNGQVDVLLSGAEIERLPENLKKALDVSRPGLFTFDALPAHIRYELIRFAIQQRRTRDPKAGLSLGLRVKNKVNLLWIDDRTFLGRLYPAGKRTSVDLSALLEIQNVQVVGEEANSVKIMISSRNHSVEALGKEIFTLLEGRQIGKSNAFIRVLN